MHVLHISINFVVSRFERVMRSDVIESIILVITRAQVLTSPRIKSIRDVIHSNDVYRIK